MDTELLIDEIAAVLDGEHGILDSAVGQTDLVIYNCCGGPGGNAYC